MYQVDYKEKTTSFIPEVIAMHVYKNMLRKFFLQNTTPYYALNKTPFPITILQRELNMF